MLLPTGTQMQSIDRAAIDGLGIPSLELMERAGQGVAGVVADLAGEQGGPLVVLCGRGNNGGDGLVAARRLAGESHRVEVWLAADPGDLSPDARTNWDRLLEAGVGASGELTLCPLGSGPVDPARLARAWSAAAMVVDALLGTGSSGPPRPPISDWIAAVNACGRPVVAVDIPSGVDADTGEVPGGAVLATVTVTLALPKLGLLLYPGREHAGAIRVVDIGIPPEAIGAAGPALELLDNPWAALALPPRPWDGHKGSFGKVVVLAGSAGMMGAGRLVSTAAYRAGAGLVRHGAPASLLAVAHAGRDEVMIIPLEDGGSGRLIPVPAEVLAGVYAWADVIALGPGLGTDPRTAAFVAQALVSSDPRRAMVLDADGLNLLASQIDLRAGWHGPLVITPHPGEAARLLERPLEAITADRVGSARALAARWEAVAVLKGAPTVVARPDGRAALCPLGNPGLASGGTGDVLTGVIAGLLAQGMEAFPAAALGAYLHALAGDLAALDVGMWSLMAGDVLGYLPAAFGYLEAWPDRDVLAEGVWT